MRLNRHDLPKFKSPSTFKLMNTPERDCKCGHFDLPDANGYCLDEDCRRDRFVAALRAGTAKCLADGTIVWFVD